MTAGVQSAQAKNNEQLPQDGEAARALQRIVLAALNRHARVLLGGAAASGSCRRCSTAMRGAPTPSATTSTTPSASCRAASGERVRTDISCTLFLAGPDEYDGGELVIEDTFGAQRVKLPAGDMVLYPGTSVHRVEPVTRGARLASFFWIESMVRSDEQRRLLFEMDRHLMRLRRRARRGRSGGDRPDRHVPQPPAPLGRRRER